MQRLVKSLDKTCDICGGEVTAIGCSNCIAKDRDKYQALFKESEAQREKLSSDWIEHQEKWTKVIDAKQRELLEAQAEVERLKEIVKTSNNCQFVTNVSKERDAAHKALEEARGKLLSLIHASSRLHDAAITSDFKLAEMGGEYEPPDGSIMDAVMESVKESREFLAAIGKVLGKKP